MPTEPTATSGGPADPLDLHRRYWSEALDLDVVAFVVALHGARETLLTTSRPIFVRHRLTPAEFDVLATLRRSPAPHELTPTGLQDAMLITSGGLTKVMLRLEERGLVSRPRRAGDQRVRPVRLLPRGKALAEEVMTQLLAATTGQLNDNYTAAERQQLTALLARLARRRPIRTAKDRI